MERTKPKPIYLATPAKYTGGAAVAELEPPESVPPEPAPPNCSVRVIHGAGDLTLDLAGQTVGQVRPMLDAILGAGPRAALLVDGRPVRDDHVLTAASTVEVVKRAGEKGSGR